MRAVPIPMRRRLDYFATGLRGRKRYYGAIASLGVGLAGLLATPFGLTFGWAVGAIGLGLSLTQFVPDWVASRRSGVQLVAVEPEVPLDGLDIGHRTWVRSQADVAVVDPDVDAVLPTSQARAEWTRLHTPLPADLAPHAYDALRARITGPNVYNGKLVRQDDDLDADTLRRDGAITLSKTTYFSLLLTNYMKQGVRNTTTGRWIQHPRELIDDGHGALLGLSDSRLANPIGISTLAFTSDGKVVVILQSWNNESAGGELAPSGSGSLDLRDVNRKLGHGERLVEVVAHGMERELREEASVTPDEIDWTYVLGYFRWMNKGAKPEYVGITKLNQHSRELARRPIALSETRFVAGRTFGAVDLAALKRDPDSPAALVVDDLPGRLSFPLVMCLRAMGNALARGGEVGERIERLA